MPGKQMIHRIKYYKAFGMLRRFDFGNDIGSDEIFGAGNIMCK
jgi:hypothetical protein